MATAGDLTFGHQSRSLVLDDPQQLGGHLRRDRHCPLILGLVLALGDAREAGLVRDERGPEPSRFSQSFWPILHYQVSERLVERFRVLREPDPDYEHAD